MSSASSSVLPMCLDTMCCPLLGSDFGGHLQDSKLAQDFCKGHSVEWLYLSEAGAVEYDDEVHWATRATETSQDSLCHCLYYIMLHASFKRQAS